MRCRIFILAALCITLSSPVFAADVRLSFHGNRAYSSGELTQFWGKTVADSLALIQDRCAALQDSLIEQDYMFARIDSFRIDAAKRGKGTLQVYVHEGNIAHLNAVNWLGDSARVSPSAFAQVTCIPGAAFHWSNVEYDVNLLLNYFENAGYPFTRIEIYRLEVDSARQSVDLDFNIYAGPLTSLQFVAFPGARVSKDKFLLQESRLRIGRQYEQKKVDAARRHLTQLDFIRRVENPNLAVSDAGLTGLRIPIEEARTTRLDIAAGYLPASNGRNALLTGLVNLEFLDLLGSGRRARIHWEQPQRRVQAIELAYREPWILGQPLAVRFDFGQRIEDTLYVTRKFGARAEVDLSSGVRAWTGVQQEAVLADSLASALLGVPESNTTYVESGISVDTRDHPTNPRAGFYFSTQAGTAWRQRKWTSTLMTAGSFRQQRGGIDSEVAQEIARYWIADVSLHARAMTTTEPEVLLPDLYRVGGARTLRGYREEQFLGSRVGWATAEMRYWLGSASRVFAFCDVGGIFREQHVNTILQRTTLVRAAVGVGLRIETDLGIWGLDYAVGKDDRPLSGKVHISLLSTF